MPQVDSSRWRRRRGQFAERGPSGLDPLGRHPHGHQVGLGKVAVVARFFLVPLAPGDVFDVVPAAGLLGHFAQLLAGFLPDGVMPLGFVLHRLFDRPEAVHVLHFDDRRGHLAGRRVDVEVDVGIDPQAALLHVAVRHAEVREQQLELGQIGLGLGRRAHVGLADDFQERRAGPVQVDLAVGQARLLVVQAFAGVLFEVCPDDADPLGLDSALGIADLQPALGAEWQIVLADLIALGQVGIVVVLAVPLGERGNLAVQGHGRPQAQLEGLAVHHRQRAGHADADRAGLRIGRRAKLRAAAAEQLCLRRQLHVDFQPNHDGIRRFAAHEALALVEERRRLNPSELGRRHVNVRQNSSGERR